MKKLSTCLFLLWASFSPVAAQDDGNDVAIADYFTASLNGDADAFECADIIASDAIGATREKVWNLWKDAVNGFSEEKLIDLEILEKRKSGSWTLPSNLESGTMPYYFGCNAYPNYDKEKKYPFFLYMHGSGDKAQEWETGIGFCLRRFYKPGIYFIPQIPNAYGEYYRWAIQSKQWAWEKLLRLAFLNDNVDPNRIYFFGISEGGYGSQRLASFYADYLAGAGPMAGGEPLKNAPMENVANIAFSLRTGALDDGFGRNLLTKKALEAADKLAAEHPGYYNHFIEVIEGAGHGIDYAPTTPWLAKYTRDAHPDYVYWENFPMYGRQREAFYNIRILERSANSASLRPCYELTREGNTLNLNVKLVRYTTTYSQGGIEMYFSKSYSKAGRGKVRIYLNEDEYDLSQPVKVLLDGTEIFNGMVTPTLETMVESCALFYDPERLFPAAVDVDIANKSVVPTSIENITVNEGMSVMDDALYDLTGRKIEEASRPGVYIKGGRKIIVK